MTARLTADDHVEIQNLYARYSRCVDFGDAEGYAATFTADGSFDSSLGNLRGHASLAQFVRDALVRRGTTTRHLPYNIEIEAAPGGARGRAYFVLVRAAAGDKPPAVLVTGQYSDALVKTAEGWRFSQRTATIDG
ncbi:MAG: nuclear transport factor 2 family protein [Gammaproteobacteria bacterium]